MLALVVVTWSGVAYPDGPRICLYNPLTEPNLVPDNPAYEVVGNIAAGDSTQKGRFVPGSASTCEAPKGVPGTRNTSVDVNYDAYAFENRYNVASCVSVTVYRDGAAGSTLQVAAYLDSFDATDIRSNYLADAGADDAAVYNFSFHVPARTNFVVALSGAATQTTSVGYRLAATNCGGLLSTGVAPRTAPTTGGSTITVEGMGFTGAGPLDVVFEPASANVADVAYRATNVVVVDDRTLTATLPSAPAGLYNLVVTSEMPPFFSSPLTLEFEFTCPALPATRADTSLQCKASGPSNGGGSSAAPLACTNAFEPEDPEAFAVGTTRDPIVGELLTGAPNQKGLFASHVNPPNTPPDQAYTFPTCEAPRPPSAVVDSTSDFPYDAYVFRNRSTTASCISTRVVTTPFPGGGNGSSLYAAAYLGSFDPNDIQANYLADTNGGVVDVMHFKVPAQTDFVVVLSAQPSKSPLEEPTLPPMDRRYLLYVGGCGR
ncbi:hypothetical protein AKJ09_06884 [Labilithrix luteola]|uniref:IPT/TIG domain-containing protein n=2 Tax=Labilithrix luteola TaxID=1391654 RepID=A0A0K1Q330_9BACT|nr:hypothetical protein AKJ09_06884 [Labilithrix luteola]